MVVKKTAVVEKFAAEIVDQTVKAIAVLDVYTEHLLKQVAWDARIHQKGHM
jgi:hypothetical protein